MRTMLLRTVAALGVLGAISVAASAAPTLNRIDAPRGEHADIVPAYYVWHHHHYEHRHWEHTHWRYY